MSDDIKTSYRTVFPRVDRGLFIKAWKSGNNFWIEGKGVKGEYFTHKFYGRDMINTCESYFSALRAGYPLWGV